MKEKFARWDMLFFQYLKRDYKKIIIWVAGLGLFAGGLVPVFEELAKGDGLMGMYETMLNPAMIAMVGPTPIKAVGAYTLGAMYSHEMLVFCSLFAMTISILHVVGHTRKEEDLGLTELVRSFQVGRQANSLAVIKETFFINVLLAIFTAGVLISFGAETITKEGSILFGASLGIAGIIGGAIALLMAQIMPASSGATGSSLGIMGLLYLTRAWSDVSNLDYSMFNPFGWTYLTFPFTENNWMPVVYALIFSAVMLVLSFALEGNRDMGSAYLPEREGRARARSGLLSVPGLFLRLSKITIIAWLVTFFVLGAAYGAIYGDMEVFIGSNDLMKQMFTAAGTSVEESFTATLMIITVGLVGILPIALVNKVFSEEKASRLSQLFSTKVSRGKIYWTNIVIAVVFGVFGILLSAGSLGTVAISVMETSNLGLVDFLAIGFNLLPTLLFFIGLAGLVLGWLPGLGKLVYVYLIYSFFLDYFQGMFKIPDWLLKTGPQKWLAKMPIEDFNLTAFLVMSALGLALMVLGSWGYARRDMLEGA